MTDAPKRAALYARVSTADQAEEGTSLGTQLDACRTRAVDRGWTVADQYVDAGVSGAKDSRPELDRLMADAEAGLVDVIVFAKLDRFSRSMAHLTAAVEQLTVWGVELVSLGEAIDTGGPLGDLMRNMLGSFAQYERTLINQRTMEGLAATAKAGGWPGGPAPFGLRRVRGVDDRHTTLAIHEEQAEVIRTAARLVIELGSPWNAAIELNALGLRPQKAQRWTNTMVRRLLLSDYLGGTAMYNKPWTPGGGGHRPTSGAEPIEIPCPVILDPDTLAEVRLRIAARAAGPKAAARCYPLSGLLLGECGKRYNGIYREDRDRRSYRCQGTKHFGGHRCDDHYIEAGRVEEQVWQVVCDLLGDAGRLADLAAGHLGADVLSPVPVPETLADLDARVARAEQALASSMVQWAKAGMDAGAMGAASAALNAELAALRARRDRVAAWQADADASAAQAGRLQALAAAAAERLPTLPPAERKQVLELLDVRVQVAEWHLCAPCFGSGRVRDRTTPGGVTCPTCSGNRWVPSLRITGAVHEALLATIGGPDSGVSRPSTYCRR